MIVRFTRRAKRDLEQIVNYLAPLSPQGARRVALGLQETFKVLGEEPRSRVRTRRPDVFVKIVIGYPCKVFCRLGNQAVQILHVRHSSRRPWIP